MDLSIGEVARLTGLGVKTIRYYADIGLVPETRRSAAGYRRYDEHGLARVELVRILRDLGLDLAGIRRVTDRRTSLEAIAAAHADAIDLQIHQLALRRAVLRAIARGISDPKEVQRMTTFAKASADEARRITEEFIASVFAGHEENPFAARMRAALPVLPESPTSAQIDAWIDLAGLVGDPDFLARVRQMVIEGERERATQHISDTDAATQRAGTVLVERAFAAIRTGVSPSSPEAVATVDDVTALFAAAVGREDSPAYRAELAQLMETFSDPRVERYWQLIGVINGWEPQASLIPAYEWFIAALRAT
jgi:DNA-binding transcriptional MerR regulator